MSPDLETDASLASVPQPRTWPVVVAGIGIVATIIAAFLSPADAVQGELVRIMYVHVPAAWLAYVAFSVTLVASIGYLVTKNIRWDHRAVASAEVGVFLTGLTILLGMIWGKPTWGVWWTWDARLTLTAIMFFVYLGYLALRRSFQDPTTRARRSAILGIIGAFQIPIVHFSVLWWRGLHQPPTTLRPDEPQLEAPMLITLLLAVTAFTLLYAAIMNRRVYLARLEYATHESMIDDNTVAGDVVAAPTFATDTGVSR